MKRLFSTVTFLFVVAIASGAFAQTPVTSKDGGATTVCPENWEVKAKGNDRAAFTFDQPDTKSQIEVISTTLLTADVKDTFFSTFHDGLKQAGFTQSDRSDQTYGAHEGTLTTYSFEHSGATLTVSVFQFMMGNEAWLVVSYAGKDAAKDVQTAFEAVVSNLDTQAKQDEEGE